MNRLEKGIVISYWLFILAYIPCFFLVPLRYIGQLLAFGIPGMVLGIASFVVVFRDLYKREFSNTNIKVTWTVLILMFWPTVLVYLYKHGFRAR